IHRVGRRIADVIFHGFVEVVNGLKSRILAVAPVDDVSLAVACGIQQRSRGDEGESAAIEGRERATDIPSRSVEKIEVVAKPLGGPDFEIGGDNTLAVFGEGAI